MEYIAKITEREKVANQFWKYTFLDIQTNQEDYFCHKEQIDYVPDIAGRLNLYEDKTLNHLNKTLIIPLKG